MNVQFVCEVGYNHGGDVNRAIEIIDAFNFCDVFKFQKMSPIHFLSRSKYEMKCADSINYFGETYGEHRELLELSMADHEIVKDYVQSLGKKWACSACDMPSAKNVLSLKPYYVKIPSCRCNNFSLIDYCLNNFKGFVHVSTGMTTKKERNAVLTKSNRIIPYSCTSDYSGIGNIYIERMSGFSCHVPDIFYAKAAIMNGSQYIEYHCTTDRDLPGTDNKISLIPDEYFELIEWYNDNIDKIDRIKFKKPGGLPVGEECARKKLWATA